MKKKAPAAFSIVSFNSRDYHRRLGCSHLIVFCHLLTQLHTDQQRVHRVRQNSNKWLHSVREIAETCNKRLNLPMKSGNTVKVTWLYLAWRPWVWTQTDVTSPVIWNYLPLHPHDPSHASAIFRCRLDTYSLRSICHTHGFAQCINAQCIRCFC